MPGLFVGLVVALEPDDLAVALERHDVCRHAVEEPAVVGDDHRAAGEKFQRLLHGPDRVHVQVVCRLVQQDDRVTLASRLSIRAGRTGSARRPTVSLKPLPND